MSESSFDKARKYKILNAISYSEAAIVSKIIMKNDTGNVSLFAFDKGQQLSEHTAPFDALVQIMEGRAKININREDYLLNKGDMIIMPANIPHAIESVERFTMILTMIKN